MKIKGEKGEGITSLAYVCLVIMLHFFRFAPPVQNNSQEQLSDGSQTQFGFSQPEDSQEFFTQANGSEKPDVSMYK